MRKEGNDRGSPELINTPAPFNENFTEKKRQLKADSKEKSRYVKSSEEKNKENSKPSAPVLNLNKDLNKISLESRKTRSGKIAEVSLASSKILEENSPEPVVKTEKR